MHDATFYVRYIDYFVSSKSAVVSKSVHSNAGPSFILLYTSHFLQTFGDRLWQFAVPLLLTELFVNTLFPQALFTFFTYFAVFCFMPLFGAWIDSTNRLFVVTTTIWIQNLCIVISSVIMFILAYYHSEIITHHSNINNIDYKLILAFGALLVTSMIGQIMGKGATLSLEKDWVVILCSSESGAKDKELLSMVNARMKRIDLICKIVAPALFGIYTEFLGQTSLQKVYYGSVVLIIWNVVGLILEWMTIKILYDENSNVLSVTNRRGKKAKKDNAFVLIARGWRAYIKSPVLLASIAYCMIYVNVLNGGVLVTAYLRFKGISYLTLGITKGFGAIFGILGTMITPYLYNTRNLSMELIALLSIWALFAALSPVGIGDIIVGQNAFVLAYIMLVCMIFARLPLWSFDLSLNQLMQTKNDDDVRAQVSGTQMALCNIFRMVSSVLTMVLHKVDEFYIVIWVTLTFTIGSSLVYTLWFLCYKERSNDDADKNNNDL